MTTDICMLTVALYYSDEAGSLLMAAYLWIITGAGFRYGQKYLLWATSCSLSALIFLFKFNSFWGEHLNITLGWVIVIVVIPIFMSSLIRKLKQAIQKAEDANQAKSQFLANMSHELRTPLGGIIGATDLLAMTDLHKNQKRYVQMIQSSGKSLLSLIEDVLDISKIEAGKLTSETKAFDLHELIASIEQTFLPHVQKKGLKLTTHVDPHIPFQLLGDELHLRQVLMNFLSNATKFTPKGHVDLYTELERQDDDTFWVRFRIVDTGIGMDSETQSKIFESFTQADASITREFGGTGLGTTISKALIELMNGTLSISSEKGKGSEFRFSLPLKRQHESKVQVRTAKSFADMHVITLLQSHLQAKVSKHIQHWGPNLEPLQDEEQLLPAIIKAQKNEQTHAVPIIDANKLSSSPQDFLTSLHATPNLEHLPIILISSELAAHEHDALLQCGFSALLSPPLNESLLFNALHEACAITQHAPQPNVIPVIKKHKAKNAQQKHCILVAEDNEVNQIVITEILKIAGYQTHLAEDGEQALDILSEPNNTFDMAILDLNMPNMSGLEVLKAYRFLEVNAHLPIIMLSADALSSHMQECLDSGADGYLTKPIEQDKLLTTIDTLIGASTPKHSAIIQSLPTTNKQQEWQYIDASVLDKLKNMSARENFLESVLEKFIAGTEQKVSKLKQAAANQDNKTFITIGHTLKGGSGIIGAVAISHLFDDIESQQQLTQPMMNDMVVKLTTIFRETKAELERYLT
ncbi:response regulator [bacterium AH-315-I20]|nr:response regulator [bacterium AH-315-I20]